MSQNNIKFEDDAPFCDACVLGKMHRLPFPSSSSETTRVGDLIHADLCGPMEVDSIGKSKYFLLFKDDYSSFVKLYFIKNKYEVKKCFSNFILRVKNETNQNINILRTDNGLEFLNKDMDEIMEKYRIKHEKTVPYTPEQNGKAERENRTLIESARTVLLNKTLKKSLWAEAVNFAAYILNRTRKTSLNKSPYELWHGKKPSISYFRIFGTEVYYHIPKQKRLKWDQKAKLGLFAGYDEGVKGFKVLIPESNKVDLFINVKFKNELIKNGKINLNQLIDDCYLQVNFNNKNSSFNDIINNVDQNYQNENVIAEQENLNINNNLEQMNLNYRR